MPVGLVNNEEFQKELDRLSGEKKESHQKESQVTIIEKPQKGRNGALEVPDSLRQIIGEESVINGRQAALEIASQFGISPSQVSAYAKGATSTATYDTPSRSIISHINKSRQRAIKKASRTLNGALAAISQEKLDYADAKDLSVIAKNMSAIIKDLEPRESSSEDASGTRAPQFILYAPQFRKEESFEVIEVKE